MAQKSKSSTEAQKATAPEAEQATQEQSEQALTEEQKAAQLAPNETETAPDGESAGATGNEAPGTNEAPVPGNPEQASAETVMMSPVVPPVSNPTPEPQEKVEDVDKPTGKMVKVVSLSTMAMYQPGSQKFIPPGAQVNLEDDAWLRRNINGGMLKRI